LLLTGNRVTRLNPVGFLHQQTPEILLKTELLRTMS